MSDDESVPLVIDLRREDGLPVILLVGDLDVASAPSLWDVVQATVGEGVLGEGRRITFDLSGLHFADSTGANLFARLLRDHVNVTLRHPTPKVRKLLAVTGLDRALTVVDAEG